MPTDKRQRQRENSRARQEAIRAAQRQSARRRQIFTTIVAIVGIVGILFLAGLVGGDDKKDSKPTTTTTTAAAAPATKVGSAKCPPTDGSATRQVTFDGRPRNCIDKDKTYTATFTTDVGEFKVELDQKIAPVTVNNFVFLARYKYYEGITFHRVIPGFMIQGGDPEGTGSGGPGYSIPDEFRPEYKFAKGDIAMAKTPAPNSGGSQFFVVTGPQGESLPPEYSYFGKVTSGFDIVQKIEADGNKDPNAGGVPPEVTHKIISVTITES